MVECKHQSLHSKVPVIEASKDSFKPLIYENTTRNIDRETLRGSEFLRVCAINSESKTRSSKGADSRLERNVYFGGNTRRSLSLFL